MFVLIPLLITEVQQEFLAIGNFRERTVHPLPSGKLCKPSILMAPKQTFVFVSINKNYFPLPLCSSRQEILPTKITCWLYVRRLENSRKGRYGIHMPSNFKVLTNVDSFTCLHYIKRIACSKPLIKDKYKCPQLSNVHYQS